MSFRVQHLDCGFITITNLRPGFYFEYAIIPPILLIYNKVTVKLTLGESFLYNGNIYARFLHRLFCCPALVSVV